jgi:hypothetical protein
MPHEEGEIKRVGSSRRGGDKKRNKEEKGEM